MEEFFLALPFTLNGLVRLASSVPTGEEYVRSD